MISFNDWLNVRERALTDLSGQWSDTKDVTRHDVKPFLSGLGRGALAGAGAAIPGFMLGGPVGAAAAGIGAGWLNAYLAAKRANADSYRKNMKRL